LNRRRLNSYLLAGLAVAWFCPAAVAHDSWLIADKSTANDGDLLWLSFVTGEVFPIGEAATDPARVAEFVDRSAGRTEEVSGYSPQDSGLSVRRPITGGGVHVIGCALKPRTLELTPDKFEEYLRSERAEEALRRFIAGRAKGGDSEDSEKVVEEYTKFAKTIVEVRPYKADDKHYEAPLGHRLEIIPLSNPARWKAGGKVRVRALLDGHPWPRVAISSGHEGRQVHDYAATTLTDRQGEAAIELTRSGHWFIKAHLIRPTEGLGRTQWESFWASLSLRVLGKTDVVGDLQTIEAIHGGLDPAAVAGFRMGRRALAMLALPSGATELFALHKSPAEAHYAAAVDGIQAATGATLGRLNLLLEPVATAAESETLFFNRATGESVTFRATAGLSRLLRKSFGAPAREAALRAATMTDEELFEVSPLMKSPPAVSTASPFDRVSRPRFSGARDSTAQPGR